MNKFLVFVILLFTASQNLHAQTAPDAAELTKLLNDFLAGASRNDVAMHDRFWADDLIYTRSAGRRVTKAEVLHDVRSASAPKPDDPKTVYTAEDVRIQQYGTTAIVAFRLVGTTTRDGTTQVAQFLNTGTFLKRNDKWQVVAWQSTRMPRIPQESKDQILAAQTELERAVLNGDVKKLEALYDDNFVWTQTDGTQITRGKLLDLFRSGQLKYAKLESSNVSVATYAETAIVRGVSSEQTTNSSGLVKSFFTLTYVNQGGDWKAVAMHTSRAQ